MPSTINGIGTWYYGKGRIHRRNAACSFCGNIGELESYDTTLFFVVFLIPLIPLSRKRVLEECPRCRKHRVANLKKWEESKNNDLATLMEKLSADPDDPETIRSAIGLAVGYQDEALFDKLADTLAGHRRDDADIQAQLGGAYGYFARWPEAEEAYRAALAVNDNPELRQSLALTLLKQGRPQDAEPLLKHILDQKLHDQVGMLYLLIESYQAQGLHPEAIELIDRRDETFPELAQSKEHRAQRKTSERYRSSGKKVRSAFLNESVQAGYREGGKGWLPWVIGPVVFSVLLGWYLIAAVNGGNARRVFLVNGRDKPYKINVNGQEHSLAVGGATAIEVPEGDVQLDFRDPQMRRDPVSVHIETPFFSRPFLNRTFVINPDQLAFLLLERTEYSAAPHDVNLPHEVHAGPMLLSADVDYQFVEFPKSLTVKKHETIRKSRIALLPARDSQDRIQLLTQSVQNPAQRVEYGKRWLALEPQNTFFLYWVLSQLPAEEAITFLTPRLADRPIRVEWHVAYQSLMEKGHPEKDLRPEYRRLVQETQDQADSLYLLGRLLDFDEGDKLYQQAAAAMPPSVRALHGLGWRALARGQFTEAADVLTKAHRLAPGDAFLEREYDSALLATRDYDQLLANVSAEGGGTNLFTLYGQLRIYAAKGDKAKIDDTVRQVRQLLQSPQHAAMRPMLEPMMEMNLCLCAHDVAGYLVQAAKLPKPSLFEPALLQGKLEEAAGKLEDPEESKMRLRRGLVYLAARKNGNAALAEQQWPLILEALEKGGRAERQLREILAGHVPLDVKTLLRLPIDPNEKRVLLLVAAEHFPEEAKPLRELAQKLDFQHDVVSLCLWQLTTASAPAAR